MAKESKHRRNDKKKPMMSLKEKRAKKHEKAFTRGERFPEASAQEL